MLISQPLIAYGRDPSPQFWCWHKSRSNDSEICYSSNHSFLPICQTWPNLRFDCSGKDPILTSAEPEEKKVVELFWDNEPKTIKQLLDEYTLEAKIGGRWPGTTLFLMEARSRSGKLEQAAENQHYKLFLVSWLNRLSISQCFERRSLFGACLTFEFFPSQSFREGSPHGHHPADWWICHCTRCIPLCKSWEGGRTSPKEDERRGGSMLNFPIISVLDKTWIFHCHASSLLAVPLSFRSQSGSRKPIWVCAVCTSCANFWNL